MKGQGLVKKAIVSESESHCRQLQITLSCVQMRSHSMYSTVQSLPECFSYPLEHIQPCLNPQGIML